MIVPSTRRFEGCFDIASPPLVQLPVQHGRAASGAPVNGADRHGHDRLLEIACWSCGTASETLVLGPPGLALCHACVLAGDVAAAVAFQGPCSFCQKLVGASAGWFRRGKRRACIVRGASTICHECLGLMRDIVAERSREESAT
jgi:hypothetical protein